MINYKYNEGELIDEFKKYIDSTYTQHYSQNNFQATEFVIDGGHGTGFCIGNVMKYAQRYGKKGSAADARKDLLKVLHYALIQLYIHDKEKSDEITFNIDGLGDTITLNLQEGYPEPFEVSYSDDLLDPLGLYQPYPQDRS
jgi:hypothetical protein